MNTKLKNGVRTSEFALVVVIAVLTQINVLQVGGDRMKGIVTTALAVAYALSRGLAKAFPPKDDVTVTDPAVVPPDEGDPGKVA